MSTVDAAIINYITNGGGSSGGGYTAGAGIALRNKAISVDYDPATMEINAHGQLASKISGGGSGGGSSSIYTAGPGISVDDYNKISVVYNPNTMELVDGAISAKVSESGAVSTDVGVKVDGSVTVGHESDNTVQINEFHTINDTYTGMLLKLKNKTTGNVDTFVLVRTDYKTPTKGLEEWAGLSSMSYNAVFYPLFEGGSVYNAKIYSDDGLTYTIRIEDNIFANYENSPESTFMRPVQLTTRTLSAINSANQQLFLNWNNFMKYLETTVEKIKTKIGGV